MSDEETIISAFDAGTLDVLTTSWCSLGDLTLSSSLFNTFSCEQNRFSYEVIEKICYKNALRIF